MKKHKEIDLEQDEEAHRKAHKFKILGFILFALILAAVLAGAAGNGVLSDDKQTDPSTGERLETEKFTRYESSLEIRIYANTALAGADSLFDISFPASYLDNYTIESILPEPEITELEGDRNVYRFRVRKPSGGQLITYHLRSHTAFRTVKADILLESNAKFAVSQFIYP